MRFLPPPESGSDLFHLRSTSSNPRSNDRIVEMRVSTAFVINGDHVELDADADTAIANAFAAATGGVRLRHYPFVPERVKAALNS
jgi:hypothetical protein